MIRGHFLVVFVSLLHLAAAENVKYALLGQTVILNPEIKATGANNILWKHNRDKVVEFNGNEQEVYPPFKDRITLDWHTAELEITDLRYEDSGDYDLEVFVNKEFKTFPFKLKVIGKVSKPSISCEIEDTSSDESGNRASLKCSAESSRSESLMKFEWSWRGSMQPGPNLTIPLGDENDEEEYNCTVSNPMSRETTTFSARSCYSETNSTGIIVGCVVAFIAVLLVILGLLLFLKRRRRKPEQNRSDPEQNPLMNTQSTSQSLPQSPDCAQEDDDIEPVDVKKTAKRFQQIIDKHENSTPAKPPGLAKALSPLKLNFSVTSQEGGIDEHKKENNLDQVSGELPQNPAGESSLEEKNQSDEENRSDPEQRTLNGGLSTSQSPLQSPDCAQEDDDTEPDKGINSPSGKPPHTPTPPSPPAPDPSNIADEGGIDKHEEDNNSDQITGKPPQNPAGESSLEEGKQQTEILQGSKPEVPHIGIDIPNGADTAAANQAEKNNTVSNSQSTSDNEASDTKEKPAGQQEDQVPVNPTPGDAKDSEMSLAVDGVGDSPTETQTSGQIENEPDPENSKQEETKNTKDDQEENQQPESQRSSRQGSHDSLKSAGISTDETDKQDKVSSRRSSQSENNSKETGGDEGERQDEQRDADASEHVDSANSVSDKVIDSPTPATREPSQNPAGESSLEDKNQSDGGKTSDPEHKSNASTEPGPGKGGAASSSGPEGAEQNRSDPEQNPLLNTQPTSQSPPQPAGFAEENDDTESVDVKKTTQNFQQMMDEHENSTPAKPPGLAKALSPLKFNFSVTSQEGGIDKQNKENNLDQVSGELPQNPAGESSLEEKNPSDEENRSDPEQRTLNGGLSTSPSPLQSPDCAQEDDDTEPDKGINSPSGKPPHTPTPLSPPAPDPSNTPDEGGIDKHKEDNNLDQITGKPPQHTTGESSLEEGKHQTEVLQGSKPEIPHIGIDIPIVADTAAANQAEKDNIVSNSQSTSDNEASDTKEEPAGQQEDQVPVNPTPGDAKDSEMSLAADGVGDSPTETQTSGQIENEPDPENSKQEENKNTKDDQEENQQPESQRSSRQGSHDSLKSAGISTDETDKQDKVSSRRSSQSENNSDATGGDEGEKQNEQRDADASEHVDSANSDKESNSPTPATGEPSPNTSGESSSEDKNQSNVTSQEGGIDKQNKENNLDQVSGELPQNPAGESSLEEKNPSDEENKGDPDKGKINNKESDPGKEGAASSSGAEGAEKKRSDGEQNLSVTSPALRLLQGNLTDINTKTTSSQEQDPGSSSGPEGADEEIYATPPRSPEPSPPPATDCSNTPDKPKKGNEVSAEITKKH
uniref:Ig-like domain-containing protein n=1 Tax=Salarias fasciatus TaxID=181472 RepID=A0A672JQ55_SALFA